MDFATARGLQACTAQLDPLEPISFTLPALAGACQLCCYLS